LWLLVGFCSIHCFSSYTHALIKSQVPRATLAHAQVANEPVEAANDHVAPDTNDEFFDALQVRPLVY
jgi:hypothetical protein